MKEVSIAVIGATGAVGMEFLRILEERRFPASHIRLTASPRSVGKRVAVHGQELVVQETTPDSFKGIDIAFISGNSKLSLELGPAAVEAGAMVIDDSSAFRMRPGVPLVVPEVNGQDVEWHGGIISIPNCATTPLVMAAEPLHRLNPVSRIIAATYQSVSGAGGAAMTELREQTAGMFQGTAPSPKAQPHQIAFNVIPRIDDFVSDGYTKEEEKVREETRKIMHAPEMAVAATCVRVPVYVSHSAAVHMEFQRPMDPAEARSILAAAPGITVVDSPDEGLYPMPVDVAGTDDVYVGRIRKDTSHPNGLVMWVVADNLRKGAALNAIQIAEEVLKRDCLKPRRKGTLATASSGLNGVGEGGSSFQADWAYYQENRDRLLKEYGGRYVAIVDRTVVDSDDEFETLAKRVYATHGYRPIVMTQVEAEPRVVSVRSPRVAGR